MPDLRIQTNIDNGDLTEDCDKMSQPSAQLELNLEPRDTPLEEFDELFQSIFGKEKNKQFSYAPSYEKRGLTKAPLYPIKIG